MFGAARSTVQGASGRAIPYAANAVRFNLDRLNRGSALTGSADGPAFTLSFWFKFIGGDGVLIFLFNTPSNRISFHRLGSSDKLRMQVTPGGSATKWLAETTAGFSSSVNTGWHHMLIAANLVSTPVGLMFIDDVDSVHTDVTGPLEATMDFESTTEWAVGGHNSGNVDRIDAEMADFWFDESFIDISVQANRRKFITPGLKPSDLGADGSAPTGSQPILFFSGDTDAWHTNKGDGGGFTENGALADAASSPSD